jgi:hypothetical protein
MKLNLDCASLDGDDGDKLDLFDNFDYGEEKLNLDYDVELANGGGKLGRSSCAKKEVLQQRNSLSDSFEAIMREVWAERLPRFKEAVFPIRKA